MVTEEELFSEVKNTFKSYDEQGLIDEISMRTWLKSEIKRFGNNIMVHTDDIVEVKNGKGKLPDDFWTLTSAYRYFPSHYTVEEGDDSELCKSSYWRNKIKRSDFFIEGHHCDDKCNYVKEEYSHGNSKASIYYKNPERLRLREGFNKKAVGKDCANLPHKAKKGHKNQINILGNYIQTEFESGFIYINYRAIPMDDEGKVVIPTTQHDRLFIYLQYHLKARTAEDLLLNGDDPNMWNKYQMLEQKSNDALSAAMTEAKAKVLDPSTWLSLRNANRLRHRKFVTMFPSPNMQRYNNGY